MKPLSKKLYAQSSATEWQLRAISRREKVCLFGIVHDVFLRHSRYRSGANVRYASIAVDCRWADLAAAAISVFIVCVSLSCRQRTAESAITDDAESVRVRAEVQIVGRGRDATQECRSRDHPGEHGGRVQLR